VSYRAFHHIRDSLRHRKGGCTVVRVDLAVVRAIVRNELRLIRSDPGPILGFIAIPLLLMAVMRPAIGIVLRNEGYQGANGSEQVVPAITAMFFFFWIGYTGLLLFREHGWGTWERLQTTAARRSEILIGKMIPLVMLIAFQVVVLFALGGVLFDLSSKGPLVALALAGVPLMLCVVAMTLAAAAIAETANQINAIGTLATMIFAALGGSLIPLGSLPDWARAIGHGTPLYWMNTASEAVILKGDGVSSVLAPAAVLLGFTLAFGLVALSRFSFTDAKRID
jgi:ABC-2 type transport system permease protein